MWLSGLIYAELVTEAGAGSPGKISQPLPLLTLSALLPFYQVLLTEPDT